MKPFIWQFMQFYSVLDGNSEPLLSVFKDNDASTPMYYVIDSNNPTVIIAAIYQKVWGAYGSYLYSTGKRVMHETNDLAEVFKEVQARINNND